MAKCFISELLILLSEKYKLLIITGKVSETLRVAVTVKLRVIINTMKLRLKRVGVHEMVNILNEVHRILRFMEFVILTNRGSSTDPLNNDSIDYMMVMKEYGFGNVMFSVNQYSLRDDERMKALLFRFIEEHVPADIRKVQISVISKYKVCMSQMKYVNLCDVQWLMCDKGHPYIMRTFDDAVLQCECNQNTEGKIEIMKHLMYLAHPQHNRSEIQQQRSHQASVVSNVSTESSKFKGNHSSHENLKKTQQKNEYQQPSSGRYQPNSRQNEYGQQKIMHVNWMNQFPTDESTGINRGFNQRGRFRSNNINGNSDEIPSLLDINFASLQNPNTSARGKQNQRGRGGRQGRGRRRGQKN